MSNTRKIDDVYSYINKIHQLRVTVPKSESGPWKVEKFTVSEDEAKFHNLRCAISMGGMGRGREITSGNYTKLTHKNAYHLIMSDTPAEIEDQMQFLWNAKGHVLINGLGLGWTVGTAGNHPLVDRLTVIEIDEDLISLVGPHYQKQFGDKLTIIHADAYKYKPPKGIHYGAVWHDIWDEICSDNLEGMKKLHRKYGRRTDWQGSWCRDLCQHR